MLKLPWMQFYPADWMRDTACLSLAARGAWITITCNLWGAPERGRLSMPLPAWGRILGVSAKSAGRSIEELSARGICECVTECNGDVTLVSRRMVRDEKARESTRYRLKRFRNAHKTPPCNGLVTAQKSEVRSQKSESESEEEKKEEEEKKKETPPPAASATPSAFTPPQGKFQKPTPAEVTEYARSKGIELDGEVFVSFYESKGWRVGTAPMKSWRAAVTGTWRRGTSMGGNNASRATAEHRMVKASREHDEHLAAPVIQFK